MYNYYTQCIILHTVYNLTFSDNFELLGVTLRCFVTRQLLSRIYALLSVNFQASNCGCVKKVTNMMYGGETIVMTLLSMFFQRHSLVFIVQ